MMPPFSTARDISADEFRYITALLHQHTGIRLAAGKEALVAGRLDKRIRQLGLAHYTDYIGLLRSGHDTAELRHLIDLLTTNETSFFRESQHFEFLRRVVLDRPANQLFRLWSAASSTGEEAYTAAMVLADTLPAEAAWQIVGTDISTRVVDAARQALYPIAAAHKIPQPFLRRYCLRGRDEYEGYLTIGRELRARVEFHWHNLMEDFRHLGRFDVIMLRNVMIYFDMDTKRELVPRLEEMLVPGGHLIIGTSESLNSIPSGLRMVLPSIYRRTGAGGA
jgi:chemotaxis protein methyltransferase CheR